MIICLQGFLVLGDLALRHVAHVEKFPPQRKDTVLVAADDAQAGDRQGLVVATATSTILYPACRSIAATPYKIIRCDIEAYRAVPHHRE